MKKIFLFPLLMLLFAASAQSQTNADTVYFNSKVKANLETGRTGKPFLVCDRLDISDQVDFEKVPWFRVRAHDDALRYDTLRPNFSTATKMSVETKCPLVALMRICRP